MVQYSRLVWWDDQLLYRQIQNSITIFSSKRIIKLFQTWYPDTVRKILGRENISSLRGFIHKYVRNMVLNLVGPESLKNMLPEIEQVAQRTLQQWSCKDGIELKEASSSVRNGTYFDL